MSFVGIGSALARQPTVLDGHFGKSQLLIAVRQCQPSRKIARIGVELRSQHLHFVIAIARIHRVDRLPILITLLSRRR